MPADIVLLVERSLNPSLELELWNLHIEFLHQDLEHVVDLSMDDHGSLIVEWGFLEVDNNQLSTHS